MTSSCVLSDIVYYPVKSLKGIHLKTATLDSFGIKNDRRLMMIDAENRFVTQRTFPQLALLDVSITSSSDDMLEAITITGASIGRFTILIEDFYSSAASKIQVKIWRDDVDARVLTNSFTEALSKWLGLTIRLAYMDELSYRQVDRTFFSGDQRVSFADGFPVLLTSEFSLNDLNGRLDKPVSMDNFRPNLVVSGNLTPFSEDNWKRLTVGGVVFDVVKPCSRCVITTIDELGIKSQHSEPLMTLSQYRKNEFGICFGQNLVHLTTGQLSVGDLIKFE